MIVIEQVNGYWVGWVDGEFVTLHKDLEILMAILKNV